MLMVEANERTKEHCYCCNFCCYKSERRQLAFCRISDLAHLLVSNPILFDQFHNFETTLLREIDTFFVELLWFFFVRSFASIHVP